MQRIRYADAGMDMKKLTLFFFRKIWLVLAAAVIGAALGGGIYMAASVVPESEREYRAMAKVYLDFAPDETGEAYQAYNGYTWNDLMATDPILDVTMANLPEGYTREEVMAATKAEILSDLRLLTVTITAKDPDRCNAILEATGRSLAARGDAAKEFKQIAVIQETEALLVTADSRTFQAVLVGCAASVFLTIVGMMLYYTLDDRICVASDFKQVTDAPFLGYAGAEGVLGEDYESSLAYLKEKHGSVYVLSVTQTGKITEECWQELERAGSVAAVVGYGKVHAVYFAYLLERLRLRGCEPAGVAVADADGKFLRRYYGRLPKGGVGADRQEV